MLLSIQFFLCCCCSIVPSPTSFNSTIPSIIRKCLDEGTNILLTSIYLNTSLYDKTSMDVNTSIYVTTHAIETIHQPTDEQHKFLRRVRELVALRRDPDALQDIGIDRIKRLWALDWSHKSIAKVSGLGVKSLQTLQRKGQAKQRIRAPVKTRLSKYTSKGTANVHINPGAKGTEEVHSSTA
jgi:hypothetical protein